MKTKKFLAGILAGMLALGTFSIDAEAMSRKEISAIQVKKSGNFQYWNKKAESVTALKNYVKEVTNRRSPNFIPVEDRIAVFDLDGTLICETAPCYFEWMMYLDRALYDSTYVPSEADRTYAELVESEIRAGHFPTGQFPKDMDRRQAMSQESVFAGMTSAEFENYVRNFMVKPVEGLSNLRYGESFYLPMVEVVKYLQANDFTVYIVSGTDRPILRILAGDLLKIRSNNIIGTDAEFLAANQGNKDGLDYNFTRSDYLIRGQFIMKNVKENKVLNIAQEIGKQPVLAFGNSGGDTAMLNYTITNNKYKSLSFMVLCDDTDRELGSPSKAANCAKLSQQNGWITISMRDDFKTIYGDNVKRN